jgi:hypothetical protein
MRTVAHYYNDRRAFLPHIQEYDGVSDHKFNYLCVNTIQFSSVKNAVFLDVTLVGTDVLEKAYVAS